MSFIIALILQWIAWMANTIRKKTGLWCEIKTKVVKNAVSGKKHYWLITQKNGYQIYGSKIWVEIIIESTSPKKKKGTDTSMVQKIKFAKKINQHNEDVMSLIPFKSDLHHISC